MTKQTQLSANITHMPDEEPGGEVKIYQAPLVGEISCNHGISNKQTITVTACDQHPGCGWYLCPTCDLDNHIAYLLPAIYFS